MRQTILCALTICVIIAVAAVILWPVFATPKQYDPRVGIRTITKQVAVALQIYESDYNRLPPGSSTEEWKKSIEYLTKNFQFVDEALGDGTVRLNISLARQSLEKLKAPSRIPLVLGYKEGDSQLHVAFADAHVESFSPKSIEGQWYLALFR